ncbi:MAG: glycosyltransferase family 39 protein [Candidatus Zixiibacteriota bacterium]|nr:MAG: glycosyltransferase family 39 protein [candidate division Zixibacteria bacterium]
MNRKFYSFLFGIAVFRLGFAFFLPAAPQEAYYWNYSRHAALSYFDHPPLAAYFIKLTTIFGVSGFSVHLAAIILSTLSSIVIYRLASLLFDDTTAFWSAVAINLTFIYALGSMIITPDTPMLLFWCLSMLACYSIDRDRGKIWWILLGFFIGAGFMSKYSMVFAGLGAFLYFVLSRKRVKWFTTIWPYVALIVAVITTLPVLIWNYQNDWASFAFQTGRRVDEMGRFRPDFFFGFIGAVIGIYGIVPIPLLFAGIWHSIKGFLWGNFSNHALIVCFSVPLLLFLIPVSAKSWVKMNWTTPAFIGIFIAATAYYFTKKSRLVQTWGKISIGFLILSFIAIHTLALIPGIYFGRGDYFTGWDRLARRIETVRKDVPEPYFICGYEYKTASLLAFYLDDHPETVSNTIIGRPGLQYDYWCDPDTLVGYNAVFVYDKRNKLKSPSELADRFEKVEFDSGIHIEKGGKEITEFYIFRCYNYRGL